MKNIILLLILNLLIISCGNDYNPNYVDKSANVLDSIYSNNFGQIEKLFNKIDLLDLEKLLSSKTTFLDSTNTSDIISKTKGLFKREPFLNDSLNLTSENTILINNTSNWFHFYGMTDSIVGKLKSKYVISEFPKNSYENNSLTFSDAVPNYFHYYNNTNFFKIYRDSINLKEKNRLKSFHNYKLNDIKKIEYSLIVNDIYVVKPYLINKENFSGGLLICSVDLYKIASKKLLGRAILYVKNSEEVNHMFTIDFGNLTNRVINQQLQKDLLKQKNKKIVDYFNIK